MPRDAEALSRIAEEIDRLERTSFHLTRLARSPVCAIVTWNTLHS
jgi:hypothetical protein